MNNLIRTTATTASDNSIFCIVNRPIKLASAIPTPPGMKDIAPTISTILGTAYPNGCTGNPLVEITE